MAEFVSRLQFLLPLGIEALKILNILTSSAVHKKLVSFFAQAAVPFKGAEFVSFSSAGLFALDKRRRGTLFVQKGEKEVVS